MIRVFSFVGSCAGEASFTARLSDMAAERLRLLAEAGGESVEYERVTGADIRIDFCRSCDSCFKKGFCPLDSGDDMAALKQKILDADVLFFCTPVYLGTMSGFAKCVMDRISYWAHRFELAGKTAAVLVSTSNSYGKETADWLKKCLQYMGASVAYSGAACRHQGTPNIHLPSQIEPELDAAAENILACLASPESFVEHWQDRHYWHWNWLNQKTRTFMDLIGEEPPEEVIVRERSGQLDFGSLQEYIISLKSDTQNTEDR